MKAEKKCGRCGVVRPSAEFYSRFVRGIPALQGCCKACNAARQREYVASLTPEKLAEKRRKDRDARLRQTYGLTRAEQNDLWAAQQGRCAICADPLVRTKYGHATDHCHTTGKVRELLCAPCNHGLGNFRDDPARLRAAIAYLELHRPEHEGTQKEPSCPSSQTTRSLPG